MTGKLWKYGVVGVHSTSPEGEELARKSKTRERAEWALKYDTPDYHSKRIVRLRWDKNTCRHTWAAKEAE